MKVKTGACTKCGGDVFLSWDVDTRRYVGQCLQCSKEERNVNAPSKSTT